MDILKNGKVYVVGIHPTKNEKVKQLELRSETESTIQENQVGFFLKGLEGVSPTVSKRVAFQSISTDQIEALGIAEGVDLAEKIKQPCRIKVSEVLTARTWESNGKTFAQEARPCRAERRESLYQCTCPVLLLFHPIARHFDV